MTRRAAPLAWVLNLDADVELASPSGYQPTNAVRAAMAPWIAVLSRSLLAPGDLLVDESTPPRSAGGLVGRAFCPTPRAIALLRRAGAEPEAHPPLEVLRTVNGRAFSASLGQTLPGAIFVRDLDAALEHLASRPPSSDGWRIKRAFGMAGRGQRVLPFGAPWTDADRTFLRAGIAEGGVQIEPQVSIARELAQHGLIDAAGALREGRLVVQECDARGRWVATRVVDDVDEVAQDLREEIAKELRRVGGALFAAGYFGPFGIDAYEYRVPGSAKDAAPTLALQPRSEINARYSMGFAVGFDGIRS